MRYEPAKIGVALINADNSLSSQDSLALSKLGFSNIHLFPSLEEARIFLPDASLQLVLLGDKAGDIAGKECLLRIKHDGELKHKAVVMVSADGRRESVLGAVSAGCGGYVLRPYNLETFAKHLKAAWESCRPDTKSQERVDKGMRLIATGHFGEAVEELSAVTEQENNSLEWFNKGLEHLRKQEFGKAIVCFNKAVALNALHAEAYKGLAYAHKGLGDTGKHLEYLHKAAEILAMQDKLHELRELYVEILSHDPEAVNPYNTLGMRLRRSGDLTGALHAYTRALDLTPTDENLHYNIAKAFYHAGKREEAIYHLKQALAIREAFPEAADMLSKIDVPHP